MRRIIDGLRYDTETAEEIAWYGNGPDPQNFHYYRETLYRTPRGRWFLHGRGGPASPYAQPYGQTGSQSGSAIIPMTDDEVVAWLEEGGYVSTLEEHFPDRIQDA